MFSFVEEFTQYDMNFYFFWLAIGLASSNEFRSMNDNELKNWFKGVFVSRTPIPKSLGRFKIVNGKF
ncbi:hypothetical protein D3C72_2529360 [compost metagenome]